MPLLRVNWVSQRFEVNVNNTSEVKAPAQSETSSGYRIPGSLLVVYACLIFFLGWFGHQRWAEFSPPTANLPAAAIVAASPVRAPIQEQAQPNIAAEQTASPSTPPAVATETVPPPDKKPVIGWQTAKPGELPFIAFSAHVYTSDPAKRSVTLNGTLYHEGDTPYKGLIIEQIQQDVLIFSFNGEPFVLDSLQDWPGGKPDSDMIEGDSQ
ncbi:general secretion pathway protein [Musicola paradisiaca Ech703]|uniref:General secretion pathway protein n=1 Tax=Musicola paradisiaca (strain Ech703) TaxID=579405 RepID=C6C303_MUSP7|nr:general secretion pathway protein [Musicola paradisiaca Ech703]